MTRESFEQLMMRDNVFELYDEVPNDLLE